ncbi:MAG: spore cortex biosynthesis protein YabQ [Bacillota bacterium]|nr:spore cortex biosynthesis protein YabQ [Bacillota bacterium]
MSAPGWMQQQLWQLLLSLLIGLGLGLSYDLYRGILGRSHPLPGDYWWRDLLFSLCCSILALLLWFGLSDGSLRPAVFAWMGSALLLYFLLLRPRLRAEKWMQNKQKPRALREKKAQQPPKTGKQWNLKAARKLCLGWRRLGKIASARKTPDPPEKI